MQGASEERGAILVLDDDVRNSGLLADWLTSAGYPVRIGDGARPTEGDPGPAPAVVCVNLALERAFGPDFLRKWIERDRHVPMVIFGEHALASRAGVMLDAGAYDFVGKPFDRETFLRVVRRADEHRALLASVRGLRGALRQEMSILNLRELEKRAIERALETTNGNLSEAARLLGIGRATIYRKLAAYDIHAPS